jgi:hypothetical protein
MKQHTAMEQQRPAKLGQPGAAAASAPVVLFSGRPTMRTSGGSRSASAAQGGRFHRRGGLPAQKNRQGQPLLLAQKLPSLTRRQTRMRPMCWKHAEAAAAAAHLGAAPAAAAPACHRCSASRLQALPRPAPTPALACGDSASTRTAVVLGASVLATGSKETCQQGPTLLSEALSAISLRNEQRHRWAKRRDAGALTCSCAQSRWTAAPTTPHAAKGSTARLQGHSSRRQ